MTYAIGVPKVSQVAGESPLHGGPEDLGTAGAAPAQMMEGSSQ